MSGEAERPISELFVAVVEWALKNGGEGAHERPGLWIGNTSATDDCPACEVRMNPHFEEVDGVGAVTARITPSDAMGPIAACFCHPYGGTLTGFTEADLIAHFEAQP